MCENNLHGNVFNSQAFKRHERVIRLSNFISKIMPLNEAKANSPERHILGPQNSVLTPPSPQSHIEKSLNEHHCFIMREHDTMLDLPQLMFSDQDKYATFFALETNFPQGADSFLSWLIFSNVSFSYLRKHPITL